ncbi:hypothetical protein CU048_14320 [Beijerinckiaceae bacterium]|nr:hypothetical protein CU048_14320 [Beijerinckiaceae bacterium]
MARTIGKIAIFTAGLMLCASGFASARPCHVRRHGSLTRRPSVFIGRELGPQAPDVTELRPDPTAQYGYIKNPEMMGGSLGAMLQGKNPAAGALP